MGAGQPEAIDAAIVSSAYHRFPGTTLTVCAITLRNGFIVTGESAAASPENFDEEIGRSIAFNNARSKIWAFEGYLLRERLAAATDPLEAARNRTARRDIHGDGRTSAEALR